MTGTTKALLEMLVGFKSDRPNKCGPKDIRRLSNNLVKPDNEKLIYYSSS